MKISNNEVFAQLNERGLPYNMTGMLQLPVFRGCTWDIFTRGMYRNLIHVRVKNVTFRRHWWTGRPRVASYDTCEQKVDSSWVPVKIDFNEYIYDEIVCSRITHNPEGVVDCVVFPRNIHFEALWVGSVFYPHDRAPGSINNVVEVVGWKKPHEALFIPETLNSHQISRDGKVFPSLWK